MGSTAPSTARPTDWPLVHYAERAKGGAGLVMTEMTACRPGRITPDVPPLRTAHEAAWRRIVDFIIRDRAKSRSTRAFRTKDRSSLGDMDAPLPDGTGRRLSVRVAWSVRISAA